MVTMTRIGFGLIGCGSIARSAHLPALAVLRDRARLVAVADIVPEAAQRAAAQYDAAAYGDYRQVLAHPDVQAVIVATPEAMHAEQVVAAAAACKHVLCEKPMASSVAEADAMIGACARAGVRLMVGHSRRFTSRYLEIRKSLDQGGIGTVRMVRENERRVRGFADPEGVAYTPRHWTGDPRVNLGVAMMAGIHEADILRWFMDDAPVSVFAEHAVQRAGNVGVPDFISIVVRFANGGIGATEISWMPPPGYPAFHQLELYGTEGVLRARDQDSIGLTRYARAGASFPGAHEMLLRNGPIYVREVAEFIGGIAEGRSMWVSPEDARLALATALGAIRSAEQHRPVTVGEMLAGSGGAAPGGSA